MVGGKDVGNDVAVTGVVNGTVVNAVVGKRVVPATVVNRWVVVCDVGTAVVTGATVETPTKIGKGR